MPGKSPTGTGPGGGAGRKLAIIGAGPMGLFAAYAAARRGWDVTVLERGRVGESLLGWGSVRLFTPLDMNLPEGLRGTLPGLPPPEAILTGPEMVERVLLPLARCPLLYDRVRTRHRVASIGRAGMGRRDFAGHPVRHERPFRLAVEGPEGEFLLDADRVMDASGAGIPAWAGPGGLPAPGERGFPAGSPVIRGLGGLEAWVEGRSAGRVLLLGHGHSAAHALERLGEAAERHPGVSVTWAFRSRNLRPLKETPSDPLPERARSVAGANSRAASPPAWLEVRRGAALVSLASLREPPDPRSGHRLRAEVSVLGGAPESLGDFDAVAAFTGYRPDSSFLSELALDLSPATEGARRLHAALAGVTDCLSVPTVTAADLGSGEPGFHLVGARSYGRSSAFLLRDGIRHVEMILDHDA